MESIPFAIIFCRAAIIAASCCRCGGRLEVLLLLLEAGVAFDRYSGTVG